MTDALTMYWHALWFEASRLLPISFAITGLVFLKFHQAENPEATFLPTKCSISAIQFIIFASEVMAQKDDGHTAPAPLTWRRPFLLKFTPRFHI
jgi:hypothetical protein